MQPSPQLLSFAEVLLGDHFTEFQVILNDFQAMGPEDFGEKYPCFELICDDLADMDEDERAEEDFSPELLHLYAEDKNLMARVDWAGEDDSGDVAAFVTRMMEVRKIDGFSWNTDKFNATLDLDNMRRGEYVPLLLKAVDRRLQELGCRLVVFFMGDDSYPFAVMPEADFVKVDRLAWSVNGVLSAENMNDYDPSGELDDLGEDEDEDEEENAQNFDCPFVAKKSLLLLDPERLACTMILSEDRSLLAVGYVDGTLRLLDMETGTVRGLPKRHSDRCPTLSFSQDASLLISPSLDGNVRIWNTQTGEELYDFYIYGKACSGGFSPDKTIAATGLAGPFFLTQFWDMQTGENIATFNKHKNFVGGFDFLDNERVIAFAADQTPYLLNARTGEQIRMFKGHSGMVYCGEVSPDKTRLATSSEDQTIRVWNLLDETEKPIILKGHDAPVSFVVFMPDGRGLLTGDGLGTIRLWSLDTRKTVRHFEAHTAMIVTIKVSQDGKRFLSAGMDGKVILWDIETVTPLCVADCETPVPYTNFTKDENGFVTLSEATGVLVWELTSNRAEASGRPRLWELPEHVDETVDPLVKAMAMFSENDDEENADESNIRIREEKRSHDGLYSLRLDVEHCLRLYGIVGDECRCELGKCSDSIQFGFFGQSHSFYLYDPASNSGIRLWNADSASLTFSFGESDLYVDRPNSVAVDEKGSKLLYGTPNGSAHVCDVRKGVLTATLDGDGSAVCALAFFPDGTKAVAATRNARIYVWDTTSGKRLFSSETLTSIPETLKVDAAGNIEVRDRMNNCTVICPD